MTFLEETKSSLLRAQGIRPAELVRRDVLGIDMNFEPAEAPARKVIELFNQIAVDHLGSLPDVQLNTIKTSADSFYRLISQMLEFKTNVPDATNQREELLRQITSCYTDYFNQLFNVISYISSRQTDYGALERDARAKIQQTIDFAEDKSRELEDYSAESKRVLEEIKKVAAEQGASQQALYFKSESEKHAEQVRIWQKRIVALAVLAIAYLFISPYIHKIPYLAPQNTYESVQLSISKSLAFAVIAYVLILCGRNFLSHQHNAIVNKHRQNALLTFRALSDAAGSEKNRDIVLMHAAACIYSPQETGYTRGGQQTNVTGLVETIPRLIQGSPQTN